MPFQKLSAEVTESTLSPEAQGWGQLKYVRGVFLWKSKAKVGRVPLPPHASFFIFCLRGRSRHQKSIQGSPQSYLCVYLFYVRSWKKQSRKKT